MEQFFVRQYLKKKGMDPKLIEMVGKKSSRKETFNGQLQEAIKEKLIEKSRPSKKRVGRAEATGRDFAFEFRETKSKRRRIKLFFKLWFLNLKRRDIAIQNVFWAAVTLPPSFITDVVHSYEYKGGAYSDLKKIPIYIPKRLSKALQILLNPDTRGLVNWTDVVLSTGRKALQRFVIFQVLLSLLETILMLMYSDPKGTLKRKRLVNIAKKLKVEGADGMHMDQLRVAIAQKLVDINTK